MAVFFKLIRACVASIYNRVNYNIIIKYEFECRFKIVAKRVLIRCKAVVDFIIILRLKAMRILIVFKIVMVIV